VLVSVPSVLQELMPLLTQRTNALLVPPAQHLLLDQSFLPTVLTVMRRPLDVSLALPLLLVNAQSVMLDIT